MTASTAVATIEPKQVGIVADLRRMEKQFALALPEHVSPERFVRVVVTAVQSNPDLLKADRESVLSAAVKCAQDGLLPDGREAALVVYGGKAAYLPMIAGVLAKVRRSGELLTISSHIVYEKDAFNYVLGDDERIEHQPFLTGPRGKAIAGYAVAKTKDGGVYREVMSLEEIEKVRNVSRAKNAGPWVQWWGEMARKTILRRLAKRLPMSTDLQQVFSRDDDHYDVRRGAEGAAKLRRLHADFDEPETPANASETDGAIDATFDPPSDDGLPIRDDTPIEAASEPGGANNPVGGADDFPGDRPTFDALGWAADENRKIDAAETVADLDALTNAPGAGERFAALQAASPGVATALQAATRGKRKALVDKEREL